MGLPGLGERQVDNRLLTDDASADGIKYLFRNASGATQGYVLTGPFCEERMDLDRSLSTNNEEKIMA